MTENRHHHHGHRSNNNANSSGNHILVADPLDLGAARIRPQYERVVGIEYRSPLDKNHRNAIAPQLLPVLHGGCSSTVAHSSSQAATGSSGHSHHSKASSPPSVSSATCPPNFDFIGKEAELLIASVGTGRSETVIELVRVDFQHNGRSTLRQPLLTLPGYRDIVHASLSTRGPRTDECYVCFTEVVHPEYHSHSGAGFQQQQLPVYRMWLQCVSTDLSLEITVDEPGELSPQHNPGYRSIHMLQVGYFIRPKKEGGPVFLLRICDYTLLQLREVVLKPGPRGRGQRIELRGEHNVVKRHLWHHWDPIRQRVSFWAFRQQYTFRMVQFHGELNERTTLFEMSAKKTDPLPFGPPPRLPMCTANSSLNVNFHQTLLPLWYESGFEDIALCYQRLVVVRTGTPNGGSATGSSTTSATGVARHQMHVTIRLLHNWLHVIYVVIDLEGSRALAAAVAQQRVTFIFLEGVIAILLPGVFVHFVDVAHHDQPPKYMFGVDLAPSSPSGNNSNNSRVTPSPCISPPFAVPCGTPFTTVPNGRSNWVVGANGPTLYRVSLNRQALWRWIRENNASAELQDIHSAIHVVTTHFPVPNREQAARYVFKILREQPSSLRPSILCQMLIGEVYCTVREHCRERKNPYWTHIPMSDEHGLQELEELKVTRRHVSAYSFVPDREFVREMCNTTPEAWWLQDAVPRKAFLFSWLRKKSHCAPTQQRISLTSGIVRVSQRYNYEEAVFKMLESLEVPKQMARFVATDYSATMTGLIDSILQAYEHKYKATLPTRKALHFLHNVKIALLTLDFPMPVSFDQRYMKLAMTQSPVAIVLEGIRCNLFRPSIELLLECFPTLAKAAAACAMDYGILRLPIQTIPGNSLEENNNKNNNIATNSGESTDNENTREKGKSAVNAVDSAEIDNNNRKNDNDGDADVFDINDKEVEELHPTDDDYNASLVGLYHCIPNMVKPMDYPIVTAMSAVVCSSVISSDMKQEMVAAECPEAILQFYRHHLPMDSQFGKYTPLNKYAMTTSPCCSAPAASDGRRERALATMREALYPMIELRPSYYE